MIRPASSIVCATFSLAFSAFLLPQESQAVLIASQGFEAEPTPSTGTEQFIDADITSHALADQALENVVSAGIGAELGFSAFHTSTGSNGHNDGDDVGVHSVTQVGFTFAFAGMNDASNNGYLIGDPDGRTTVSFSAVDLSLASNVVVSLDFFANSTTWETGDLMHVELVTNLGSNFLLDINDGDTLDLGTAAISEGVWSNLSFNIPDAATTATLSVELETNSNLEAIVFDNIQFNGDVVPEPSSALLLLTGFAGLMFGRRRR